MTRPLAIVTGASTGIGFELAKCAAQDGRDLIVVADEPEIMRASEALRAFGGSVEPVEADLATEAGAGRVLDAVAGRPVDALIANAGIGVPGSFLDQDWPKARHVVETNVNGALALIHAIGREMRARGDGRILLTGSTAGYVPGAFNAVYNGTKAFLDSFAYALREELKDSGVTVTVLMPGPTDTEFFERADMLDTPVGETDVKADPAKVARDGYEAMKAGRAGIVSGLMNKLQVMFSGLVPETVLAKMHRRMAEPGRDAPK